MAVKVKSKKTGKLGYVQKQVNSFSELIYYVVKWEDGAVTKEALTDIKEIQ